jgi:hypothetical protein
VVIFKLDIIMAAGDVEKPDEGSSHCSAGRDILGQSRV